MTIQEYCINEKCVSIKMKFEYILVNEDKYIISRIKKGDKMDIQSMPKRQHLIAIIPPIFIVFFLFMIWETIQKQDYFFLSLYSFITILFSIEYFYQLLYLTNESIIKKEKIIKIYKGKIMNNLYIKYRDNNNNVKIRGVAFMKNKHLKEFTIQHLKEYGVLNEK